MPEKYGEGGYGEGGYGTGEPEPATEGGGYAVAICRGCGVIYVVDERFEHSCRGWVSFLRRRR